MTKSDKFANYKSKNIQQNLINYPLNLKIINLKYEIMEIVFKSAKEMVNFLMDNEGVIIYDSYGRQWKYDKYRFFFKDIGKSEKFEQKIDCLHLFATTLKCS